MRIELILLGATLVLGLVQIFVAGNLRTRQYGKSWNVGARDETMPPLDPLPARLLRAQANLFETLPLFIGAILACAVTGHFSLKSQIGAHLYFWGRLVYVPLYAAGIPAVRTIVWTIATIGLLLVIASLLLG
jgi:uncharacterized MAPEG superfamily protein